MSTAYNFLLDFSLVIYFTKNTVAGTNYGEYPENSKEYHNFYKRIGPEMHELATSYLDVTSATMPAFIDPATIKDLKLEKTDAYFEIFKRYYNRHYIQLSLEEEGHRKIVFANNLKKLLHLRNFIPTANFEMNQYLDFTLEEFHLHFTGFNETGLNYNSKEVQEFKHSTDPPDQLDWSAANFDFLPRHQGNCRGSYLFSALANVELQEMRVYGNTYGYYSVLEPYDCETYGSCAYGGLPHLILQTIMYLGGATEDETAGNPALPYVMRAKGPCDYWKQRIKYLEITKVIRLKVDNEDELAAAIHELGPVITAIYVSEALKNYRSGILTGIDCIERPNHAVLIVGYGTDKDGIPYWIIRNSWGSEWGEHGHFFLRRGMGECGFGEYLVTVSVQRVLQTTNNHPNPEIPSPLHSTMKPAMNTTAVNTINRRSILFR